jgi:hypothetical protein
LNERHLSSKVVDAAAMWGSARNKTDTKGVNILAGERQIKQLFNVV